MGPHYVSVRHHIAGLAIALAIAGPVSAKDARLPSAASAATSSAALAAVRIDNFGRINDRYYRGALPAEQDFGALARLGVKTLIDLTGDDGNAGERRLAEDAGMKFFKIAMTTRAVPTADQISAFLSIVNDAANQPVYVHCVGGKHRTGVMTAIYRMIEDKWAPGRAFQEMKSYKFGADFLHPEFKKFVLAFKPAPSGVPALPAAPESR